MRFTVLLLLVLSTTLSAAESLSPTLDRAVAAYGKSVEKAQEAYDKEKAKAKDAMQAAFQKEYQSLMKKGDEAEATAVLEALGELLEKNPKDLIPKDPALALVGTWSAVWDLGTVGSNIARETWVFDADGACQNGAIHGTWKRSPRGGWLINWATGVQDEVPLITWDDAIVTAQRTTGGKSISMQRK